MARYAEVWVLTQGENRKPIERALVDSTLHNAHFVYFDLPHSTRLWRRLLGFHLMYYLWQIGAYHVAKKLHQRIGFDLVHHVTVGVYWMPSFLALLPPPFVWGPVGGGESAPLAFWSSLSIRGKAYELLRDFARRLGEFDPFLRATARKATMTFSTTDETNKRLEALSCPRVISFPQVGLPNETIRQLADLGDCRQSDKSPFRLLSLGRLLHWKGFDLGLRAFARFQSKFPRSEYWVIGRGPERQRLERLARRLRVAESVHFWGPLPRILALEKLAQCSVLVHPSLHDSGGLVCLEAMAAGLPVICLKLGGPAVQVVEQTGIVVPAISPEQAVDGIADAMLQLAGDRSRLARMSQAAREHVEQHFSWERKGERLVSIYRQVIGEHSVGCQNA
jgi:glycosyltransferase involved in cell wall biosynthesis